MTTLYYDPYSGTYYAEDEPYMYDPYSGGLYGYQPNIGWEILKWIFGGGQSQPAPQPAPGPVIVSYPMPPAPPNYPMPPNYPAPPVAPNYPVPPTPPPPPRTAPAYDPPTRTVSPPTTGSGGSITMPNLPVATRVKYWAMPGKPEDGYWLAISPAFTWSKSDIRNSNQWNVAPWPVKKVTNPDGSQYLIKGAKDLRRGTGSYAGRYWVVHDHNNPNPILELGPQAQAVEVKPVLPH